MEHKWTDINAPESGALTLKRRDIFGIKQKYFQFGSGPSGVKHGPPQQTGALTGTNAQQHSSELHSRYFKSYKSTQNPFVHVQTQKKDKTTYTPIHTHTLHRDGRVWKLNRLSDRIRVNQSAFRTVWKQHVNQNQSKNRNFYKKIQTKQRIFVKH